MNLRVAVIGRLSRMSGVSLSESEPEEGVMVNVGRRETE